VQAPRPGFVPVLIGSGESSTTVWVPAGTDRARLALIGSDGTLPARLASALGSSPSSSAATPRVAETRSGSAGGACHTAQRPACWSGNRDQHDTHETSPERLVWDQPTSQRRQGDRPEGQHSPAQDWRVPR
jgi:hypothetical protein